MKYLSLALLVLMIACKKPAQNNNTAPAEVKGTGELKDFVLIDIPGSDAKLAQKKDMNGLVSEAGIVRKGKKNGQWYSQYPDGRMMSIRQYLDDKVEGWFMTFDDRGRIVQQTLYKDNYIDGPCKIYKQGSRLIKEAYYSKGKLNGVVKEFHERGYIQKETNFKMDKIDGKVRFYNDKGEVTLEYEYKDGVKISGPPESIE